MDTLKPILIKQKKYYLTDDLLKLNLTGLEDCANGRKIIDKRNLSKEDYIFAKLKNNKWIATKSDDKTDQVLISTKWAKNNLDQEYDVDDEDSTSSDDKDIGNICFEDIDENFQYCNFNGVKVILMKKNGYINATKLCQAVSGRRFSNWLRCTQTNELIKAASKSTKISTSKLMVMIYGGKNTTISGTYVHPILITQIALWISPEFAIKISNWIEEWKNYSSVNNIKYFTSLSQLKLYKQSNKEYTIQCALHKKYGGTIEAKTEMGCIDLLTSKYLIEIKNYNDWKCALGQLFAYSMEYPNKIKCMYLFNVGDNKTSHIKKVCNKYDIKLKIYD